MRVGNFLFSWTYKSTRPRIGTQTKIFVENKYMNFIYYFQNNIFYSPPVPLYLSIPQKNKSSMVLSTKSWNWKPKYTLLMSRRKKSHIDLKVNICSSHSETEGEVLVKQTFQAPSPKRKGGVSRLGENLSSPFSSSANFWILTCDLCYYVWLVSLLWGTFWEWESRIA